MHAHQTKQSVNHIPLAVLTVVSYIVSEACVSPVIGM